MNRKDSSAILVKRKFSFKADEVKEDGSFTGYGSVFGNVDSYNEIVMPGAFTKSLKAIKDSGDPLPMLWSHKPDEPIGGYTSLEEDERGLKVSGFLMIDEVQRAREVYALMKRRVVKGLSIGYYVLDDERDKKTGSRLLNELDLQEISPVTFPANVEANVEEVKAMRRVMEALEHNELPSIKEFEDFLREAKFSKTQAAAIANGGLSKLLRGEPGDTKGDDLAQILRGFKLTPQG